jgi:uncharacterized SAM-binding protein YcdF (DUF218 family)
VTGRSRPVLAQVARVLGAPLAVKDPLAPLDAIVVLGAPLGRGGRVTDIVAERAAAAAALWRAGGAPLVCPTGRGEADAIADLLVAAGVPEAALRVERDARNTYENALRSAALLAADDVRAVWLVTQPFHGRRARWWFRRAGLEARVWHIDDSVQFRHPARGLGWVVREYAAWARALTYR